MHDHNHQQLPCVNDSYHSDFTIRHNPHLFNWIRWDGHRSRCGWCGFGWLWPDRSNWFGPWSWGVDGHITRRGVR